ncbi:MAG TPA: radical SAM protein, partial [Candidatus Deferrimicrobium sp.]|nr:radical SAM protein [Candidatus Deferrimicrobium sp.]
MPPLSASRKTKIAGRAVHNIVTGRPITVSFELTYNCNAHCEHCDLGDYVKEPRSGPDSFAARVEELRPAVTQISGGEPLLRKDLLEIIREMRRRDPVSLFVLTTNVTLLTEEKYLRLREAGVDQFSLSLDYPDERHNTFRHLRGNFEHIRDLAPKLARHGFGDIILACVVQKDNCADLPRLAELAREWGVAMNYSTYNSLRTGKTHFLFNTDGELAELAGIVEQLIEMQESGYPILTSAWTLQRMVRFFRVGKEPGCQAGRRFLIVNPWAKLTRCGMFRQPFGSQAELTDFYRSDGQC